LTTKIFFPKIGETNKAVATNIDGANTKAPTEVGAFAKKSDFES